MRSAAPERSEQPAKVLQQRTPSTVDQHASFHTTLQELNELVLLEERNGHVSVVKRESPPSWRSSADRGQQLDVDVETVLAMEGRTPMVPGHYHESAVAHLDAEKELSLIHI